MVLAAIVTVFSLLVLGGQPFFANAELQSYDMQMARRGQLRTPQSIVFVGIDQTSIDDLNSGSYPLKRCSIADGLEFLRKARAQVVGLDLRFYAAGAYPGCDAKLVRAIKRSGNVVLAQEFSAGDSSNFVAAETQIKAPLPQFTRAARAVGVANFFPDSDGSVRYAMPLQLGPSGKSFGSRAYPTFALQLAAIARGKSPQSLMKGLPAVQLIKFVGRQSPSDSSTSILTHQFESIASPFADQRDNPTLYRNKIVIIGCAALMCVDTLPTPFGTMFGPVVQANTVYTLLDRNSVTGVGDVANTILVILMSLLTLVAALRRSLWTSLIAACAVGVGYVFLTFVLFEQFRQWAHLVLPEATLVLVFAVLMAYRFGFEERQKRRTVRIFGEYVEPEVVDLLVTAPDEEAALAGGRRPISVLFVDVRGFTSMSESMQPEDVVAALDVYLEELTQSVKLYGGTVVKYVGDELMAMWNAPVRYEDHAARAILSALDMVGRMDSVNGQLQAKNLPSIAYGIGVNSGEVVVGHMGSSMRKQYDVIGDAVNTGARLCSAAGRAEIIMGEATWYLVGDQFELEETEPLRLKGKRQALRTFRVLSPKSTANSVAERAPASA